MTARRKEFEQRIREIFCSADDPRVTFEGSDMAEDSTARRLFEEFMMPVDLLEAAAADARMEVDEALDLERAAGEERVETTIEGLLRIAPRAARGRRRTWLALVAAAALVVLALFQRPFAREESPRLLGPSAPIEITPQGEVDAWGSFRWPRIPEGAVWYVLTIRGPDGSFLAEERCATNEWTPAEHEDPLAGIKRIEWEVESYDAGSGSPREESWSVSAWLSSSGSGR